MCYRIKDQETKIDIEVEELEGKQERRRFNA